YGEAPETNLYASMSGTSMAAPQVAGITALVKQYIEDKGLSQEGLTDRALAQSIMMSTAKPMKDGDGEYYPVFQQGAGLVNAADATSFDSYVLVEGQPDGKAKAELGDDPERNGVYSFRFDLHNLTEEAQTYELSADVFTQGFFLDYANFWATTEDQTALFMDRQTTALSANVLWTADGKAVNGAGELARRDFDGDGDVDREDGQALLDYVTGQRASIQAMDWADVDGDGDVDTYDVRLFLAKLDSETVTVPAGGSVKLSVTIRLTEEAKARLDEYYTSGAYVEAYVYANAVTDSGEQTGTSHSIPVLAFYGNWSDATMFDHGIYQTYKTGETGTKSTGINSRIPHLYWPEINSFLMTYADDPYNSYFFGGNPVKTDVRYMPERNAINSENGDRITKLKTVVIRNAAASRFTVTDTGSGEVLKSVDMGTIYGSYFSKLAYIPGYYMLDTGWSPRGLAEGTQVELTLTLAPSYYVNEDGSVRWEDLGKGAFLTTPLVVDNTAPTVEAVSLNLMNNTLDVTATDNQYVSAVSLYNASGVKLLSQTGSNPDAQAGDTCTFSVDVSEVDGQKFLVQVTDYAMNTATYEIQVDLGDITLPKRIAFDLTAGCWTGFDETTTFQTLDSWMPSSDTFYGGTIVDHMIFASTDKGELYIMPESDPSDMTLITRMDAALTDMAYSKSDDVIYGVTNGKLVTVDRFTGAVMEVGTIGVTTNTLACDENGTFYCQKLGTPQVYSFTLDTIGEPELLVEVAKGINGVSIQGMEIDPNTGMLIWNAYYVSVFGTWVFPFSWYFEIDPATGEYQVIADLWDNLCCVMIPEVSQTEGSWTDPVDQVSGIQISQETMNLLVGSAAKLTATVTPWNASDRTVTWSSSNPEVASVDEAGVVTATGVGTATVTATSNLNPGLSASCTVTVDTAKTTLDGVLVDEEGNSKAFTWNTETDNTWQAGIGLDAQASSAVLDTDNDQLYIMDLDGYMHQMDMTTGKTIARSDVNLGTALWDMAYSPVFSTEDTVMITSIFQYYLLAPQDAMNLTGEAFNLESRLADAGADRLAAITSLGYGEYYNESTGELVDAEQLLLLDNIGNIWTVWIYDNGKGGMSAMADYTRSDLCSLSFPGGQNGYDMFCSLVAGEDGFLYLSYFNGDTNEIYRLRYDMAENTYKSDLLGDFGSGVWPAALYNARNNTALDAQVGRMPTGNEVELERVTIPTEAFTASAGSLHTGSLNAATGSTPVRHHNELPLELLSVEHSTDCENKTVTLTVTANNAVNNGLVTVAYDASKLTLQEKTGTAEMTSFHTQEGLVTFGYVSGEELPAGTVLATLTFGAGEDTEAVFTVTTVEENETHPNTAETVTLTVPEHDYVVAVVEPTCEEGGYTLYTCKNCGHSYRDNETEATGHDFEVTVVERGCEEDGYTLHTCKNCGYSFRDNFTAASCPSKAFSDLDTSRWYHEGVDYVLENGLMKGMGDGIFAPNGTVTRGMIVTMLYRMAGEPAVESEAPFTDVASGRYYAKAVAWAYENDIVRGITDTRFAPEASATREQLMTFLYRYAAFAGQDVSARGSLDGFSDGGTVSTFARESMGWAVAEGLLVGSAGQLMPKDTATRAQLATIIFRFLEA
ncbi:MAG: S-layer homology domain-containing protein, partial [Clostridiales bacterium]|nr:S-layer homology domain-containing protein [Clostridiales bacterium]